MKKELIAHIARQLHSYGYTVYLAKSGEYGFYTDGKRVVSFGGHWNFCVDFSGNYNAGENAKYCGTGWQIAKELTSISAEAAEIFIKAYAPSWAIGGRAVSYTTPEQHLKTYGKSSGYTLYTEEVTQ